MLKSASTLYRLQSRHHETAVMGGGLSRPAIVVRVRHATLVHTVSPEAAPPLTVIADVRQVLPCLLLLVERFEQKADAVLGPVTDRHGVAELPLACHVER